MFSTIIDNLVGNYLHITKFSVFEPRYRFCQLELRATRKQARAELSSWDCLTGYQGIAAILILRSIWGLDLSIRGIYRMCWSAGLVVSPASMPPTSSKITCILLSVSQPSSPSRVFQSQGNHNTLLPNRSICTDVCCSKHILGNGDMP